MPVCVLILTLRWLAYLVLIDYVLQRALSVVENGQRELLIAKVRPQLATMRRYSNTYSKHLLSSKSLELAFVWWS